MRTWFGEYTFKHNWETVVQASARKYPNPYNNSVTSIDLLERRLCAQSGALLSHRLVVTEFAVARNFGRLYASEFTAVDPRQKRMVMRTKNLSLCSLLTATERLEYKAHPDNPEWTLMTQSFEINAFPTIADSIVKISSSNASKGREAIEWVIQTQLEQPLLDFLAAPAAPGPLFDSYVTRMRAELDQLSTKAVQLSRDLGDELSSFGGDLVASVSHATGVHAAAPGPEDSAAAFDRQTTPAEVSTVVTQLLESDRIADEHFVIL